MKKSIIGLFSILVCVIYCSALAINISAKNNQKYSETSSYAMMVSDISNLVLVDDAFTYTKTNLLSVGNTRGLWESPYMELHDVYTTNNTKVTCAIRYLVDYNEKVAENYRKEFMKNHPTFEEKDTDSGLATSQFNCHAYAWYNASIDNPCWIRCPDEFIEDPHCIPVTGGINVQVGDIVVFVDGEKTYILRL